MFVVPLLASSGSTVGGPVPPVTADTIALAETLLRTVGRTRTGGDALALAEALNAVRLALPIVETWSVADAPGTLNGDYPWVLTHGTGRWAIVGGAAELQGISVGGPAEIGRLNVDTGTNDIRVRATIAEWHDTGSNFLVVGPMMRMQNTGALTGYSPILITVGGGVATVSIQKFVDAVQTQLGPSVTVTPHNGMTLEGRAEGDLISLYVDGVRLINATDPSPILTGRYAGLQGVATGANRVRVETLEISAPTTGAAATGADTVGLTETIQRQIGRPAVETVGLTEVLASKRVFPRTVAEPVGLTETLASTAARARFLAEGVGLFEALGITVQTHSPQLGEGVALTESLHPQLSVRAMQEVVALTESLSRVFLGVTRVGIIQLMNESVLVSGAGRRARVNARGICEMPVPEQTGLEYTADLVGRDGVIVLASDLAFLQVTLYNLADLTIINGLNRVSALNIGKGTLDVQGHMTITLDAADCAILDATKAYEHHVLLVEGSYDGATRVFRRAVDHVVVNMQRVP